jgi:hypothetical protein
VKFALLFFMLDTVNQNSSRDANYIFCLNLESIFECSSPSHHFLVSYQFPKLFKLIAISNFPRSSSKCPVRFSETLPPQKVFPEMWLYTIYASNFRGEDHLRGRLEKAQGNVNDAPARRGGGGA